MVIVLLVVRAHNNERKNTKVFFGRFWLTFLYLPEDSDQGKLQKSKASFCHLSFWLIFHIQDFCSFYSARLWLRDAKIQGWWGLLDEEEQEKVTNHHPLGLVWDWWVRTWLFVMCTNFCPLNGPGIFYNLQSFFCESCIVASIFLEKLSLRGVSSCCRGLTWLLVIIHCVI